MDPLLSSLATAGLPGLVIAALLYALRSKDQELTAERAARIADARAAQAFALEYQSKVLQGVERCGEIAEALQRGTRR
jgi:hypothetical protein